ncbi:OmpA domain protein [Oceanicola granulosus HTCC2516]|uniref:OmpA domain protein n=1 Tax=Oceanicola granulosus (strain ATCC BAA-861 / DSM 15982 / KCTC 12143 / HTCC2516) TaxID=314256 RepID=Q2CJY0_OCEGH|nr:phosphate ABC transporter substrate-binding/OmpA family protein [Oceanicola granulosus]EAR53009.1 OmpA domain protein [Oceanicola granulosus HTCC2516]
MTLEGRYLGYDGRYLRMETEAGEVTLDYEAATCTGAACPDPESFVPEVRLSGARRMGEVLLPALIAGFAAENDLIAERIEIDDSQFAYLLGTGEASVLRFRFRLSTSDEGFADLLANEADIALSVREVLPIERERGREVGLGDLGATGRSQIVAIDALVPIVSAAREAREAILLTDLARAFGGEIDDWAALGEAEAMPLVLHLTDDWTGLAQGFVERVLTATDRTLAATVVRHPDPASVAEAVAVDAQALGIVPYLSYGNAHPLGLAGACGLVSLPELTTLKTEDYPLAMPLFLYFPMRRLPPLAADFLGWMRTGPAQFIVRRAGFVDLGVERIPVRDQGQRFARAILDAGRETRLSELQRMTRLLAPRVRLSTTFRFGRGATELDPQSRTNLFQLAADIRDGAHDGQTLLLLGFTDGIGPASANRRLGAERADEVLATLLAALGGALPEGVEVRTEGFGEALPMGCDDTEWGRQINRRVELWVD